MLLSCLQAVAFLLICKSRGKARIAPRVRVLSPRLLLLRVRSLLRNRTRIGWMAFRHLHVRATRSQDNRQRRLRCSSVKRSWPRSRTMCRLRAHKEADRPSLQRRSPWNSSSHHLEVACLVPQGQSSTLPTQTAIG